MHVKRVEIVDGTCEKVRELLPWLLNGSLEETERREALEHLADCPHCSAELDATRYMFEVFSQHIPSFDLAAYTMGAEVQTLSREAVEQHLALCARCREEADRAMTDGVVDFENERKARSLKHGSHPLVQVTAMIRSPHFLAVAALLALFIVVPLTRSKLVSTEMVVEGMEQYQGRDVQAVIEDPSNVRGSEEDQVRFMLFSSGFEEGTTQEWLKEPAKE